MEPQNTICNPVSGCTHHSTYHCKCKECCYEYGKCRCQEVVQIFRNYFVKFLRDDGDVKSLDDLYRHAMHFFELGARKNLALGSDFDGSVLPECLNTPVKVASFYEYLLSRGVSQEDADGVFYKNAQAFFRKNLR